MLRHIDIRDLVIVSRLELEWHRGMTTLTGETGAGKSILIDALGLVLGDRAAPEMIRLGQERAEVTAEFAIAELPRVGEWLEAHELDSDGECILRRVLNRRGSSRAYINGAAVPVKMVQELGEQLVDIHGQHAHQSLLRRDAQRVLLDEYADHGASLAALEAIYREWRAKAQALDQLTRASLERTERLELLRFQVEELSALNLGEGELEQLESALQRLSNTARLQQGCGEVLGQLYDGEATAHTRLTWATGQLATLTEVDGGLGEARQLLEEASIQVEEASRALRDYLDTLELEPQRLAEVESRLAEIHHLARKYRRRPEGLPELLQELLAEQEQLEHAGVHRATLEQESDGLRARYIEAAERLSVSRSDAARRLEREVTERMEQLGMAGGRLQVVVERQGEQRASGSGIDAVEFLISANPGQPPLPLARAASGGELSRISLAIQVATARCNGTPTLIFDEVDVGIGGGVAEIVGKLLRDLGESRQVLCVTHLAQVASQGVQHLRVTKHTEGEQTHTEITPLCGDQRVAEVARMLGGVEITEQTLRHAQEMLERSNALG